MSMQALMSKLRTRTDDTPPADRLDQLRTALQDARAALADRTAEAESAAEALREAGDALREARTLEAIGRVSKKDMKQVRTLYDEAETADRDAREAQAAAQAAVEMLERETRETLQTARAARNEELEEKRKALASRLAEARAALTALNAELYTVEEELRCGGGPIAPGLYLSSVEEITPRQVGGAIYGDAWYKHARRQGIDLTIPEPVNIRTLLTDSRAEWVS